MPWIMVLPGTNYAMDYGYLVLLMPWIVVLPDTTNAMDCGIIWYY